MAIKRMTIEQTLASEPNVDRAKLDATTEEDIRRCVIEPGQDPDEQIRAREPEAALRALRRRAA